MGRIVGITYPIKEAEKTYTCPHCGKEYKTEAGLKKHIASEHPKK